MVTNEVTDKPDETPDIGQIGKHGMGRGQDEPDPKRTCFDEQRANDELQGYGNLQKHSMTTMPNLGESLALPITTHVGTLNIGQQGNINHNYGIEPHQMPVTNAGGTDLSQQVGLEIPQVYVQPPFDRTNQINYHQFQKDLERDGGICPENITVVPPSIQDTNMTRPNFQHNGYHVPVNQKENWPLTTALSHNRSLHQEPQGRSKQLQWRDDRDELFRSIQPHGDEVTRCVTTTEVPKKGGNPVTLTPRRRGELTAEMNYLYQKADGLPSCQSMQVTIKRTLQEKIFKSVKFLPKNNNKFKYPDWVEGVEKKEATVLIVNGVLAKMNLDGYTVKQKTRFWITYSELFRQFFTEHRSATQESLKRVFFDSALGLKSEDPKIKLIMDTLKKMIEQKPREANTVSMKGNNGENLLDANQQVLYEPELKGGLLDLRNGSYDDVLEFLMMHCFKAPLMRQAWDYDSKHKCVSAFVTVYDEALIYLMIENSLLLWEEMSSKGLKAKDCERFPKYTSDRGKNVGWSTAGMSRFNQLLKCIRGQRGDGMGYRVEEKVLSRNTVNPRGRMGGDDDDNIDIQEEEEAGFEIMD